ncbi:ABC transporter ATP-binding protein [Candidatus Fermentibacteria bacterium]|nr:ABC transporter ATP-binding protein [Candidatus Fermentibacteria bacterium]
MNRRGWRAAWIWSHWRHHRWWLVIMACFTVLSTAVTLAYPLVLKHVIDRVTSVMQHGGDGVGMGTMLVLAVLLLARIVAGLYPVARAWMNMRFELDIRGDSFDRLLKKDYRFFLHFPTGDLVTRLTDDLREYPKLAWFLSSGVFRGIDAFGRFAFCVAAIFLLEWRVALISLIPLPGGIYLYYVIRHRLHRAFDAQQKAISRTNEALEATFSGIRIVKAFTAEEGQERKLADILRERAGVQYRVARLFALTWYGDAGIGRLCQGIALLASGALVVRGDLSIGGLYAIYLYLERLMQPLTELPGLPAVARQAFVSMDRITDIDEFPSRQVPAGRAEVPRMSALQFSDVSFSYAESDPLLKDLSFQVRAGERVVLVGEVGSGKTTVLKLAAGVLSPTSGWIALNGIGLDDLNLDQYRSGIGYVPQEGALFSDTIRDNVLVGREIDDQSVLAVLDRAQIGFDVRAMEQGLGTRLGHRGTLVSGGQRQRLAIARALVGGPQLLLLDDCTASLDAETERRFWEGMARGPGGAAMLLVSHRVATVEQADWVLFIKDGRIADQGSHERLMETNPEYRWVLLGPAAAGRVTPIDSTGRSA